LILKSVRKLLAVSSAVLMLSSIGGHGVCANDQDEASNRSVEVANKLYPELEKLVQEFYRKAKVTKSDRKFHFEYKARPTMTASNRQEITPDFGGVICDIDLRDGRYQGKVKLPQQYNEHSFYSVILMAPYDAKSNVHAYTKLLYPSDTGFEFIEKFKDVMNSISTGGGAAIPSTTVENAVVPDSMPAPIVESVAGDKAPESKTFFWKATKGSETIYLLGTIHGAIAKFYPLPSAIDQAFDQSKHLMVEISIDKVDPFRISKTRDELGLYKPPDHLSKHLTPETKKVFEKYLQWSGETWEMYEKYRPWYAASIASQSKHDWYSKDFKAALGLDLYFLARAREAGKAISDLETVEQQLHIDADLSEPAQDMLLRSSLMNFIGLDAKTKGYLTAWKAGDMKMMEELSTGDYRKYPELAEYEKSLLDDRNIGMVAKIKQLMKTKPGPHFVAVGAAHMVGKNGLVSLFEKDGYKLEQVSSTVAPVAQLSASVKRRSFPERFRVWLPDEPKRVATGATVRYEFYEQAGGAYVVCIFTSPTEPSEWPVPAPLMLDKLVSIFKPEPGTRKSFTLQGFPGREIECSGTVFDTMKSVGFPGGQNKPGGGSPPSQPDTSGKPVSSKNKSGKPSAPSVSDSKELGKDVKAKIRAYLAGRRFYVLCAVGTKPFLASENVNQFFESLELVPN